MVYWLKGDDCSACKEIEQRLRSLDLPVIRNRNRDSYEICPTLTWNGEGQIPMGILQGYTNIMTYFRPLKRGTA